MDDDTPKGQVDGIRDSCGEKSAPATAREGVRKGQLGPAARWLVAVDVGVKCGFARFSSDGRLEWFQARDFGSRARLRRAAESILRDQPPLVGIVIEGGGDLAEIWKRAARRMGIPLEQVSAETWRPDLLLPRQQRGSVKAKRAALQLAEKVIADHGSKSATRLRHDAAEAILVGYWAAKRKGWI